MSIRFDLSRPCFMLKKTFVFLKWAEKCWEYELYTFLTLQMKYQQRHERGTNKEHYFVILTSHLLGYLNLVFYLTFG